VGHDAVNQFRNAPDEVVLTFASRTFAVKSLAQGDGYRAGQTFAGKPRQRTREPVGFFSFDAEGHRFLDSVSRKRHQVPNAFAADRRANTTA
jgi:hypothetical protein